MKGCKYLLSQVAEAFIVILHVKNSLRGWGIARGKFLQIRKDFIIEFILK